MSWKGSYPEPAREARFLGFGAFWGGKQKGWTWFGTHTPLDRKGGLQSRSAMLLLQVAASFKDSDCKRRKARLEIPSQQLEDVDQTSHSSQRVGKRIRTQEF